MDRPGLRTEHSRRYLHHAAAMHHGWGEYQVVALMEAFPQADAVSEHKRKKGEADLVHQLSIEALAHKVASIKVDVLAAGQGLCFGHEFGDGSADGFCFATLRSSREFVMGGDEHETVAVVPNVVIENDLIGATSHQQDAYA